MSFHVSSYSWPQTTTERSAVCTLSPPPVATLHRTVHPLRSARTPARSRLLAPPPLEAKPVLPLPRAPIAPPRSNANSGPSILAPHSHLPPSRSTHCPVPETPSAAHCSRMSVALLSLSIPAIAPKTASRSRKSLPPTHDRARPARSTFRGA